jgi:hypothetical protein
MSQSTVYMLVENGTVINRIIWDGHTPYTPPPGTFVAADDGTQIGNPTTATAVAIAALIPTSN